MNFLLNSRNQWLASWEDQETLSERISQADVCVTDLDGTVANIAEAIAFGKALRRMFSDYEYVSWFIGTAAAWLRQGNEARVGRWEEYKRRFLNTEEAKQQFEEQAKILAATLYPGASEFYSALSIPIILATRNTTAAAQEVGKVLGCRKGGIYSDIEDKGKWIDNFALHHPDYQRYLVIGDDTDEEDMILALSKLKTVGKIQDVAGIRQCKYHPAPFEFALFDAHIGSRRFDGLTKLHSKYNP